MPAPDSDELPFPHAPIRHPQPLEVGRRVRLDAEGLEALRFRQVNVREAFTLQAPDGRFFRAALEAAAGRGGEALVFEELPRSPESPLRLTLFCAVLARQRMLLVIPKVTELGVLRIVPVLTDHSVPAGGLGHEKAHAWPAAAVRATKQCRRASVPEVLPALPLAEALEGDLWRGAGARYALDDRTGEAGRVAAPAGAARVCLAVGPEGGWSDAERRRLREAGAAVVAIGGRVLRAETAALVGVALFQHRLGDLSLD